jgi:pantoate--beta-alanine ligase
LGNLHQGHTSLIQLAQQNSQKVMVSIFVNPKQFNPGEDLDTYPRTLEQDIAIVKALKIDYLFVPSIDEIYNIDSKQTCNIDIPWLTNIWCGNSRPGYFQGILTVVNILFNLIQPNLAVFGEKDFQQALLIQKMVKDLHIKTKILTAPIVREKNGLAYSSRNQYLTPTEQTQAPLLYAQLQNIEQQIKTRTSNNYLALEEQSQKYLKKQGFTIDYLKVCKQKDLQPASHTDTRIIIIAAAYLGKTRLIDNICINL